MWRNIVCAGFIMAVCLGLATADTIKGRITKTSGNKITVTTKDDATGKEYEVAKDAKIMQGKDKTELKSLSDLKIGDKGAFATITTDNAGKVTEIIVGGGKKKKDNQ